MAVIAAEGRVLDRVLGAMNRTARDGLNRQACGTVHTAQTKTSWGGRCQTLYALVNGEDVFASAEKYDLTGILDGRAVRVCGIGKVLNRPSRSGRDLAAMVAMGRVRAEPFRFHFDRDVDFIRYVITTKRLLAGLGPPDSRQLQFFIAEEGTTAAAYVVLSVVGNVWTLEECGDRDPLGTQVGALLQALIAREPGGNRPTIRAWLPARFLPPQVTIISATPSTQTVRRIETRPARHRRTEVDDERHAWSPPRAVR